MEFHRPMLAKSIKDGWLQSIAPEDYVAEIKLDGHRRLVTHDVSYSRIATEHYHKHIQKHIPTGCMLDGEIIPTEGEVSARRVTHLLAEQPYALKLVVFDILYAHGKSTMDLSWDMRHYMLDVVMSMIKSPSIARSDVYVFGDEYDLEELLDIAAEHGSEGIVIKRRDAIYKPNSRASWVKWKFTETHDVVVTDCESKPSEWRVRPGKTGKDGIFYSDGRHSDPWLAGDVGLSWGVYKNEKLVRIGPLGITGPRDEMEKRIGLVAEVKGYGTSKDTGCMKHPVLLSFRDDKDPRECTWDILVENAK